MQNALFAAQGAQEEYERDLRSAAAAQGPVQRRSAAKERWVSGDFILSLDLRRGSAPT